MALPLRTAFTATEREKLAVLVNNYCIYASQIISRSAPEYLTRALANLATVKNAGARSVILVCLVSAPEGIDHVQAEHPDVHIVTAAVDRGLDERGFIVPGLGDAGDRLYGTR